MLTPAGERQIFSKTEFRSESPSNCNMPEDVIREILLRLPVKSLLRFKSVCRQWYTLISSSTFVTQHFRHVSNQDRLIVSRYKPNLNLHSFALFLDETLSSYEEPDHLQMPDAVCDIMGPVNGVFCVLGLYKKIALLNPAMRQFKPLSLPLPEAQPHLVCVRNILGFGWDPLSGDYKLVLIYYLWDQEVHALHYPLPVYVYSSGSDSWRWYKEGGCFNSGYYAYRPRCNTYLNGVYYWHVARHDGNVAGVLAFDMTAEKFLEIQVPECTRMRRGSLALCGDSLALLSCDFDRVDKCIEIWLMGKEERWTKCFTLGPFQDVRWGFHFWKNDELLLQTEASLLTLCNVVTQKSRTVEVRVKDGVVFLDWVFCYKESLVSVKREGDNCMLWDASSNSIKGFFNE